MSAIPPLPLLPVPSPPAASVVGTSFVNQYYMCLQTSPRHLYRFYMNHSHLTLADSATASSSTVATHAEIHAKILALDYENCKAVITSVDSQYTAGNGVLVQVTGSIAGQAGQGEARAFVQSFVLAPQEKGYYVLNDIVRFTAAAPATALHAREHAAQHQARGGGGGGEMQMSSAKERQKKYTAGTHRPIALV